MKYYKDLREFAERLRENGFKGLPHSSSSLHFVPLTCTLQKNSSGEIKDVPSLVSFVKPSEKNPLIQVDVWRNANGGFSVRVQNNLRGREGYLVIVFAKDGNVERGDAVAMERLLSFPH